jgi:predicted PurR-regulated permease PerM
MDSRRVSLGVLVVLTLAVSAAFIVMIRPFLMSLLLAAIAASLLHTRFEDLAARLGGRRPLAAALVIAVVLLVVVIPLVGLIGLVTAQAVRVAETVTPWAQRMIAQPDRFTDWIEQQPGFKHFIPYEDQILERAADLVRWVSGWAVDNLSSATAGTLSFLFLLFVGLYSLFYFLMHGSALLDKVLWYLPLEDADERRLVDKFRSVTRATLLGTIAVGAVQGGMAGIALGIAGVPSVVFWTVLMMVLSVIPGVGTALVWVPACFWLWANGSPTAAIVVAVFCAVFVGSVDNVLRPRLVGRDTAMPDLLILLSTLGGIGMFGAFGLIIGPVLAAVFLTLWEMYGTAFRDVLPAGRSHGADPSVRGRRECAGSRHRHLPSSRTRRSACSVVRADQRHRARGLRQSARLPPGFERLPLHLDRLKRAGRHLELRSGDGRTEKSHAERDERVFGHTDARRRPFLGHPRRAGLHSETLELRAGWHRSAPGSGGAGRSRLPCVGRK